MPTSWIDALKMRRVQFIRHPFFLLVAFMAAATSYLTWFGIGNQAEIHPEKLEYEAGYSYWISLDHLPPRGFTLKGDMADAPDRSPLRVSEDGKALPLPHAAYDEIASVGMGRYSHRDTGLYFSASDNSDPRANGRRYTIAYKIHLKRVAAFPILAVLALCAFLGSSGIRQKLIVFLRKCIKNEFVQIGAISALSVLVLVAALELFFRINSPFNSVAWPQRFDPRVGFYFEPNSEVRHTNYLDFWVRETTNSLGFLDSEPPPPNKDDCHVTFIGDSFVEAAQVPIARKFQRLVEDAEKKRHPDWRLVTSAFGYSGTGQLNQLPFYDRFAKKFSPKLVVLVFVGNDFSNNSAILEALRNGWHPDASPRVFARKDASGAFRLTRIDPQWRDKQLQMINTSQASIPLGALKYVHDRLKRYSYHYHWVWLQLTKRFPSLNSIEGPALEAQILDRVKQLGNDPALAPAFAGWDNRFVNMDNVFYEEHLPPLFAEALEATRFALQEFKRRADSDGFQLVVLAASQLTYYSPDKNNFAYNRLQQITRDLGIPLVDQYAFIVGHGGDPIDAQFKRDGHWTEKAHQWAAEATMEFLEKNKTICEKK